MQKTRDILHKRQHYLFLILITFAAYWPLTFQLFSLKNDALVYFLPYRYHISESIQNGSFPWWNPYLYTGLPIHSDIQSGVWNPVVMLISLFTSYNMGVLEFELLIYLVIGAVGMFKLASQVGVTKTSSLIAAISYTCSGFMTDSGSLIPWITSAAYLPFVFLYFYRLLRAPSITNSLKLPVALFFLLTAGYPSFFIFCAYLLVAGIITWMIVTRKREMIMRALTFGLLSLIVFLLLCSPAILSWVDFLDYYERGSGTALQQASSNAFPLFSSISYLVPSSVSRPHPWLSTDLSARNASVGVFVFIFFILSLFRKTTILWRFVLGVIIFSFVFSLGSATPLQEWCHRFLPLMDSFRHPSSMRIFTTIGMILLAVPLIDEVITGRWRSQKKLLLVFSVGIVMILGLILLYYPESNILLKVRQEPGKGLLSMLSLPDIMVSQGILQLFFLISTGILLWRKQNRWIPSIIVLNCLVSCWIALPFTFISSVSTREVNAYISRFPPGIPHPDPGASIQAGVYANPSNVTPFGYNNFYNKTITIQDHVVTPTLSKDYTSFLGNTFLRKKLADFPFIYLSSSSDPVAGSFPTRMKDAGNIKIEDFSCNKLNLLSTAAGNSQLNIFQVYHHRWKASVDGRPIGIQKSNGAFMAIDVPAGRHTISFEYSPGAWIYAALLVSLLTIAGLMLYFIYYAVKSERSP